MVLQEASCMCSLTRLKVRRVAGVFLSGGDPYPENDLIKQAQSYSFAPLRDMFSSGFGEKIGFPLGLVAVPSVFAHSRSLPKRCTLGGGVEEEEGRAAGLWRINLDLVLGKAPAGLCCAQSFPAVLW